ncbi:methyltransferase domain-containing protein [Patescibacteria group bacterium]|nr:methyltransferase domain-containing protein [Patescibacteria group bacterium]MBU1674056.1 methyltransferase domain-containing protein [Patescibacteria group bacterium]MBU1963111.1 methyltransferase domain-containing protein [Patescibacteria group bacterium]
MVYETVIINIPEILQKVGLRPGQTVADLGTGREGRFALSAGKVVGEYGKVWAIDIAKDLLPSIETKAAMLGITNVHTLWSDLEMVGASKNTIPDDSIDLAIVATVLYQSKKKKQIMEEAVRMTKSGGKIVVVDWKKIETPFGPPMTERVDPEDVKTIASGLGLLLLEEFEAGEYHYGLIFQK